MVAAQLAIGALAAVLQVSIATIEVGKDTPKRLRIKNACGREPIWIAHEAGADVGVDEQNVRIDPFDTFHFLTPPGLAATRYWPKMGCNEKGGNCNLGGSGGPGEDCVQRPPAVKKDDYSRCAPPVDTKFEGTFDIGGFDFVDMSLVDGWTLPFTLTLSGGECTGQTGTHKSITIDCSGLSFGLCPKDEELTAAGKSVDLRAINPHTKEVAGCYAPCQKLVSGKWNNSEAKGRKHEDPEVAPYCCPTPPESPEACRAGPITSTSFLDAVHTKCPGVYGYAYDDGMGLLKCTPESTYDLTFFCPEAQTTFPNTTAAPTSTTVAKAATHADLSSKDSHSAVNLQQQVWRDSAKENNDEDHLLMTKAAVLPLMSFLQSSLQQHTVLSVALICAVVGAGAMIIWAVVSRSARPELGRHAPLPMLGTDVESHRELTSMTVANAAME